MVTFPSATTALDRDLNLNKRKPQQILIMACGSRTDPLVRTKTQVNGGSGP
jgi:hypothetical protein